VLYELAMVFLVFQDLSTARRMMTYIDSGLGRPLPEKSYAEDCEFTPTNVWVRYPAWSADAHRLMWDSERHRYILPRTYAWLVFQSSDTARLLVLLGRFMSCAKYREY
jgi:hydroxyacyl-ACP dehydratase HTD2-like protein with hotdog domain